MSRKTAKLRTGDVIWTVLAGQIAEIAVSLDETAVESHTTIEGREVRDDIRKQYVHS